MRRLAAWRFPVTTRLDAIDRNILRELQDNGRITNVELARRVGISAPPCLRRVRALEEAGYIKGYRALLDEKLLGYEVTVFAMVHLTSQADADLKAFEDFVRAVALVIAQHRRARSQRPASPRAKTARANAAIPQGSCLRTRAMIRNNCCRS